ncbi:MAG: hypothetical protein ABI274_13360 [Ktedonobacterales bacterium]
MNEACHRQRALDIEQSVADLGNPSATPHICALAIEGYWGASFRWIVVGCIRKHTWHTVMEAELVHRLHALDEPQVASDWSVLELCQMNARSASQVTPVDVMYAKKRWQRIRHWAID